MAEPYAGSDISSEEAQWGPLARALTAFRDGNRDAVVVVHSDLGTREEWPAALFFRAADELPPLEREALDRCGARVVDVGAGAGPHSLELLRRGHEVLAVESHPALASLLRSRGVARVTVRPLDSLPQACADTVLLLMNGLGLAGTLEGLVPLLESAGRLLARGGRIVADSTDPAHWMEPEEDEASLVRQDGRYGGEVQFQIEYEGRRGAPFPFLYVDPDTLRERARIAGLILETTLAFDGGTYLAILAPAEDSRA